MGVLLKSLRVIFVTLAPCFLIAQQGLLIAQQAASPAPAAGQAVLPGDPGSTEDKTIFGVLPNYRTADSTSLFKPITTKQKYTIALKDTFNYPSYGLAGFFAGISQFNNSNPSFGQGVKGYARRYASGVADQDLGNFMTEAILPSLLHEDPRYFRKSRGSGKSRFGYAVTRVFVTRTDSGGSRFNTSEVLGNGIVASIANSYYPDSRGFGDTMQRMGTQILTDSLSGVLKEFWPDIKRKLQKRHVG
jgi:hypothetical protein